MRSEKERKGMFTNENFRTKAHTNLFCAMNHSLAVCFKIHNLKYRVLQKKNTYAKILLTQYF